MAEVNLQSSQCYGTQFTTVLDIIVSICIYSVKIKQKERTVRKMKLAI